VETLYGLWFIRGNLLRDFAALNKVEVEPYLLRMGGNRSWKNWRLVSASDEELSAEDYALLDRISELSIDPDESIGEIQRTYQMQTELQPARDIVARVL
jgi:hypothetical protein